MSRESRKQILGKLWICPENMSTQAFRRDIIDMVMSEAAQDGEEYVAIAARYASLQNFDLIWKLQSAYHFDEAQKEKYRKIAADGRLLFVEVEN